MRYTRRRIGHITAIALALGAIAPGGAAAANLEEVAGSPAQRAPVLVEVSSGSGFDWGDAGIGAAAGLGVSMIVVGGGFARSQRRGRRIGAHAS